MEQNICSKKNSLVEFFVKICYVGICFVKICFVKICFVKICFVKICFVKICFVKICKKIIHKNVSKNMKFKKYSTENLPYSIKSMRFITQVYQGT
jgi:hypothetical protein